MKIMKEHNLIECYECVLNNKHDRTKTTIVDWPNSRLALVSYSLACFVFPPVITDAAIYVVNLIFDSVKRHGADFGIIPGCHLGSSAESNELASTCFVDHAFFLAFVQELFLSGSESDCLCSSVLLHVLMESEILRTRVHLLVTLSFQKSWPKRGPCGHQELLFVGLDINDAVLIFHEVLEAGGCVHYRGNRHRRAHKTEE